MRHSNQVDYSVWKEYESEVLNNMAYKSLEWIDMQLPENFSYSVNAYRDRAIIPLSRYVYRKEYEPSAWLAFNARGHRKTYNGATTEGMYNIYCYGSRIDFYVTDVMDAIVVDNLVNNTMNLDAQITLVPDHVTLLKILHTPFKEIYRPSDFVIGNNSAGEANNMDIVKKVNCQWWKPPDGQSITLYCKQKGWKETATKIAKMLKANDLYYLLKPEWQLFFGLNVPF